MPFGKPLLDLIGLLKKMLDMYCGSITVGFLDQFCEVQTLKSKFSAIQKKHFDFKIVYNT
jgi:hypothetical protein